MFEYERYRVTRPQHIGDDYWNTVEAEVARLDRSLAAGDLGQAIGDVKCLVESVAKATLDVAGTPAGPGGSFDGIVKAAHDLLVGQPGNELANESEFGKMATQACKIVRNLGPIRNEFGGGHGRARQPRVVSEMAEMAIDAGLLWTRWALRRLGLYSFGRPADLEQLVDRIVAATQQPPLTPAQESHGLRGFVLSRRAPPPAEKHEQLERLADHVTPGPFSLARSDAAMLTVLPRCIVAITRVLGRVVNARRRVRDATSCGRHP